MTTAQSIAIAKHALLLGGLRDCDERVLIPEDDDKGGEDER